MQRVGGLTRIKSTRLKIDASMLMQDGESMIVILPNLLINLILNSI